MCEIKKKQLFLLDMDGTIYHENILIDGAKDFLETLNNQKKNFVFLTNNSSKNNESYIKKLESLGISISYNQIYSSVNDTIKFLKKNPTKSKIYLVGTESLKIELISQGFIIVPPDYRELDVDYVLVGFDTELNYNKIEGACYYISIGVSYIATNIDMRCPLKGNRYIPDCGAICDLLFHATNVKPIYFGKPNKEMVYSVAEFWNVNFDDIICIGDRLYTDIALGVNAGITSALVLTGETQQIDIDKSSYKPTYIFNSIKDINKILID